MTTRDAADLKRRARAAIDARASDLIELARAILAEPEAGFKEHRTARRVREWMERLELPHQDGLAITGSRAVLECGAPGPTVAIVGELDGLPCSEHPERDPASGVAHACGHHAQIAMLMGAGLALKEVAPSLAGRVVLLAVPAEEYVELEERLALRRAGRIEFLGGKAEFVRLGLFDDVDAAMMVHTSSLPEDGLFAVGGTNNGLVAKSVRFQGRAAHAGAMPHRGVNALYAAHVALAGINAVRETFRDEDHVRVHPILTRGGDVVNAIPSDARLELFCRAATLEAIQDAHRKVDRTLKAGALALGARVEITTLPGYLPLRQDAALQALFQANAEAIVGPEQVTRRGHSGGSTDMGDISQLLPAIHPYVGAAVGAGHGPDYVVRDYTAAVVNPAQALAMTAIDLLADGGQQARRIRAAFEPALTRDAYLSYLRELSSQRTWRAEELEGVAAGPS